MKQLDAISSMIISFICYVLILNRKIYIINYQGNRDKLLLIETRVEGSENVWPLFSCYSITHDFLVFDYGGVIPNSDFKQQLLGCS